MNTPRIFRDPDDNNQAIVAGTSIRVSDVIDLLKKQYSPQFIINSSELTLTQVQAAIDYYRDHLSEIDLEMQSKGWNNRISAASAEHLQRLEEIFTTEQPLSSLQLAELAKLLRRGRVHVQQWRDDARLELVVIVEPLVKALDVLLSEVEHLRSQDNK